MTSFALSLLLLVVVFGVLGGWAYREDRRRSSRSEEH
jgi:hypothetical protein